jgi:hypothetical protein
MVQLKNSSQIKNVKNAAKQGYTKIKGESSCSKFARTKIIRTPTANKIPSTPQRIHAGKNDPRMLKVGAREHPVANRMTNAQKAIAAPRNTAGRRSGFNFVLVLWSLRIEK